MGGRTAGKTILIAEDETEIRELLGMVFENEGFTVITTCDGQEALDCVHERKEEIGLLVTDLGLPKVEGIELVRQAREIIPHLKVIAVSGFGHASVKEELQKFGVFLSKPFSHQELVSIAKELLA
jgi:DNA-binding response OmpR family regulator